MPTWTETELSLLRERYAETPGNELGELLGRSRKAVQLMAYRLGLKRGPERRSSPAIVAAGIRRRGRVVSAQTRWRLAAAHRGRTFPPEVRARMSAAQRRRRAVDVAAR